MYVNDRIVKGAQKRKTEKSPASSVSPQTDGYELSSGATLRVQLPSEAVLSPSLVRAYPFCPY